VWVYFQEWGAHQMLTSSWLKFKSPNQWHCTSPHNLTEKSYLGKLYTLAHLQHHIIVIFPCTTLAKKWDLIDP